MAGEPNNLNFIIEVILQNADKIKVLETMVEGLKTKMESLNTVLKQETKATQESGDAWQILGKKLTTLNNAFTQSNAIISVFLNDLKAKSGAPAEMIDRLGSKIRTMSMVSADAGRRIALLIEEFNQAVLKGGNFDRELSKLNSRLTDIAIGTSKTGAGMNWLGSTWVKVAARIGSARLIITNVMLAFDYLTKGIQYAAAFEQEMAKVSRVTEMTGGALKDLGTAFLRMSMEIPKTAEELAQIGFIAGQLGIRGVDNISRFTETVARLSVTLDMNVEETANAVARLSNIFSGVDFAKGIATAANHYQILGDEITYMANKSTASGKDLIDFGQRVAAIASGAGIASNEVFGFGAALKDLGFKNEVAGSAFVRFVNALTRKSKEMAEHVGIVGDEYKEFEKLIKEDMTKAILVYLEHLGKLDNLQQLNALSIKGLRLEGVRTEPLIIKMAQALGIVTENLDAANDSMSIVGVTSRGFENQINTTTSSWQRFKNILEAGLIMQFSGVNEWFGNFLKKIDDGIAAWTKFKLLTGFGQATEIEYKFGIDISEIEKYASRIKAFQLGERFGGMLPFDIGELSGKGKEIAIAKLYKYISQMNDMMIALTDTGRMTNAEFKIYENTLNNLQDPIAKVNYQLELLKNYSQQVAGSTAKTAVEQEKVTVAMQESADACAKLSDKYEYMGDKSLKRTDQAIEDINEYAKKLTEAGYSGEAWQQKMDEFTTLVMQKTNEANQKELQSELDKNRNKLESAQKTNEALLNEYISYAQSEESLTALHFQNLLAKFKDFLTKSTDMERAMAIHGMLIKTMGTPGEEWSNVKSNMEEQKSIEALQEAYDSYAKSYADDFVMMTKIRTLYNNLVDKLTKEESKDRKDDLRDKRKETSEAIKLIKEEMETLKLRYAEGLIGRQEYNEEMISLRLQEQINMRKGKMEELEATGFVTKGSLELYVKYYNNVLKLQEIMASGDVEAQKKALAQIGKLRDDAIVDWKREWSAALADMFSGTLSAGMSGGGIKGFIGSIMGSFSNTFGGLINKWIQANDDISENMKPIASSFSGMFMTAIGKLGEAITAISWERKVFLEGLNKAIDKAISAMDEYISGTKEAGFEIFAGIDQLLTAYENGQIDIIHFEMSLLELFKGLATEIGGLLAQAARGDPEAVEKLKNIIELLTRLAAEYAGTNIGRAAQFLLDQYLGQMNDAINGYYKSATDSNKQMTEESEAYFKNIKDKKEEFFSDVKKDRERVNKATVEYIAKIARMSEQYIAKINTLNEDYIAKIKKLSDEYYSKITQSFIDEIVTAFDEVVAKNDEYIDLLSGETIRTLEILAGVIQKVEDALIGKVNEIDWGVIFGGTTPGHPATGTPFSGHPSASMPFGAGGGGFEVNPPMGELAGKWEMIKGLDDFITNMGELAGKWEMIMPLGELAGKWEMIRMINELQKGAPSVQPMGELAGIWEMIKPIIESRSMSSQPISNSKQSHLTLNINSMYGDDLPRTVGNAINRFLDQKGEIKIDFMEGQLLNLTTVDDLRGVH